MFYFFNFDSNNFKHLAVLITSSDSSKFLFWILFASAANISDLILIDLSLSTLITFL